jgi:putative redox protein
MIHSITTNWVGEMQLESIIDGHKILMDAEEKFGGKNRGPRPKPLLLTALSGCSAMDVISILAKKRLIYEKFSIEVSAEMTENHPKVYKTIHVVYIFTGSNFAGNEEVLSNIRRAVELSMENYCGVAAMLKKVCELTYEIKLLNSA